MACSMLVPLALCAALSAEPSPMVVAVTDPPATTAAPAASRERPRRRRYRYRLRYHAAPRVVVVRERVEVLVPSSAPVSCALEAVTPAALVRAAFDELEPLFARIHKPARVMP